jgi:uncharacterized protein
LVIYVDTSAFVKLIWQKTESIALTHYLSMHADGGLVSSALLAIEARRAVIREDPTQLPRTDLLLTRVGQVSITDAIVESASRLLEPTLRSLDAVHLATALLLADEINILVSYDKRLCGAAAAHGIDTASPI